MREYIQATITILSLVNPTICMAMFVELEGDDLVRSGIKEAHKSALAIFVVLVVAALIGVRLLSMFNISLSAFRVAGGIVLIWMGFSMLRGSTQHASIQLTADEGANRLTPLILFAASPGTIAGVITIAASHSGTRLPVTALVGITVAVVITWILLLASTRFSGRRNTGSLVRDVTTRFMGLIVLAMGVQFALAGCQAFVKGG